MRHLPSYQCVHADGKSNAVKLPAGSIGIPELFMHAMRDLTGFFIVLLFLLLLNPMQASAQNNESLRIENGMMIVRFDKQATEDLTKLLSYFGLKEDSLWNFQNIGQLAKEGWTIHHSDKNVVEIAKPLDNGTSINWGQQPIYIEHPKAIAGTPGYPVPVEYGVNSFKAAPTVFENPKKDETVFLLRGYAQASHVYLSGNFNNWSTNGINMQHTDSGWVAIQKLKPGKYLYKFIADGQWIYDANNNKREGDGNGGYNSAYFHYNYVFTLAGHIDAKKVLLVGSFNNWNEKELVMQRMATGWRLPMYLNEGTHAYKFIVDKEWMLDPNNKVTRPDGKGNFNSFMSLGDTLFFTLKGYTGAKSVILSGNFNAWNTQELSMTKTATGWQIPYVLRPGTYEYKFIVDGQWITDPDNPLNTGSGDIVNSIRTVQANYTFILKKYPNAKEVFVSGSFNNWLKPGYPMQKKDGVWSNSVFLPAGKYTYKFVVDGNWIIDPDNPLYDENEYGTGNSVLWIEPKETLYDN
ncbi:MAG: glycogen-binding domain-containing protein [Chitinophagaceae bacterium]|nr:glycogen-binding domain-containing protein [Chitinophagaceae bacterium]